MSAVILGVDPDVWIVIVKDVQDRFDWKVRGWRHDPQDTITEIVVDLRCGHTGIFKIDGYKLLSCESPPALLDYILDEIEKPPICRCKCGKISLGPAGRPS